MATDVINEQRRAFLGTSAVVLSSAVMGGRAMAAPTAPATQVGTLKMPAVIGYPNDKGITIERVTYPARKASPRTVGMQRSL